MKFTMTKIAAGVALSFAATGAHAIAVSFMTVKDLGTVWTGGSAHVAVNSGTGSAAGTSGGTFYFRGSLFSDDMGSVPAVIADGANSQVGFDAGGGATTAFATGWGTTGIGITNGTNQKTFGGSFDFGQGATFTPNSNDCAGGTCVTGTPFGSVVGGNLAASTTGRVNGMTIDLGDFAGFFTGASANFRLNPNTNNTTGVSNQIVRTSELGGVAGELSLDQFYYSIDWTSTIQSSTGDVSNGSTDFNGFTADWHMEGIAYAPLDPHVPPIPVTPIPVPSIPEASTYGMMLAGLGMVGGMAARRRKASMK